MTLACLRDAGPIGRSLADRGLRVDQNLAPARRSFSQVISLRRYLKRAKPHVAYVLDHTNALFYGRLAARLAGVPNQIMAVHRTGRADGSPSLGRTDRLLAGLSHRVIAVSQGHRRYLQEVEGVAGDRLRVIYNGVSADSFLAPAHGEARTAQRTELGLPAEGGVVAVVAALRPEKNHRLLFEAIARMEAEHRPTVAIVGDGGERDRLRHDVSELGIDRWIRWLGQRDQVAPILAVSDVLCLPSHPMVETFPMCVLEAMAARLPVVATRVGSLDEMVEDGRTGVLVAPNQPSQLADALGQLLADPERARAMGEAGRQRVESEFTRQAMVESTASLLWELARRSGV